MARREFTLRTMFISVSCIAAACGLVRAGLVFRSEGGLLFLFVGIAFLGAGIGSLFGAVLNRRNAAGAGVAIAILATLTIAVILAALLVETR